ncbi:hypothetical protein AMECASPLE_006275 [Ameca splendens]|uniref:Uncharacterized protein n=1 Tax=Ameca splendens TaxID=208324 RepID=A0ABV0XCG7_9TELE
MGHSKGQCPKYTSKLNTKCFTDNKVNGLQCRSQSPHVSHTEKNMDSAERLLVSKAANKLNSDLSGRMGQNSNKPLLKCCGRFLKIFELTYSLNAILLRKCMSE